MSANLPDRCIPVVAVHLGGVVASIHQLPAPPAVAARELIPMLRHDAPERASRNGLPARLVEEVPAYLADAGDVSLLVHADITADHVFVAETDLEGIIDSGDAIVADRYYEFVPVYLDALGCSPELFEGFLAGYGLDFRAWSPRRALQALLQFQFDAITPIRKILDLDRASSLDELAERVFGRLAW